MAISKLAKEYCSLILLIKRGMTQGQEVDQRQSVCHWADSSKVKCARRNPERSKGAWPKKEIVIALP